MKYTLFTTYALVPTGNTSGYNRAIHCNYIKKLEIETNDINIQEIRLNFLNVNDFKFLSTNITNGTGYTVHKIYMITQVVNNDDFDENEEIIPNSANWKYLDVTNQVTGYTGTGFLTPNQLKSVVFKMPLNNYSIYSSYDLNYLYYPAESQGDYLCFGDETYFLGNVTTDIKADVYTTDISIGLSLDEFNSTTNLTWDGLSKVYISEVGLYDSDKNLVAIGKLNNPVPKDATISRTILFELDF